MSDTGDGFCLECGDWFHLDDCGGYNPPCACAQCGGALCRSCCAAERGDLDPDDDWYPEDETA